MGYETPFMCRMSQKYVSHLFGCCESAISIFRVFTQLDGSEFNLESLRPCLGQSDKFLLISGTGKAKYVVSTKTAL